MEVRPTSGCGNLGPDNSNSNQISGYSSNKLEMLDPFLDTNKKSEMVFRIYLDTNKNSLTSEIYYTTKLQIKSGTCNDQNYQYLNTMEIDCKNFKSGAENILK